jgi:ATP-dependent helicase HrpB
VVLSTDIAESSLTVAGVRVVVDAGLARVPRFDARTGMTRLTTVATSRASADQRAGRAGRTEPGVCYRLWSKLEQSTRLAHLPAEITQVDLSGLALELAVWNTPPESLSFIDPPSPKSLQTARQLLVDLGALAADGSPTPTGRSMLALPVHPRLARMIVDAAPTDRGLACVLAALVDERDVLRGRFDELPADLALRVRLVCGEGGDERADEPGLNAPNDDLQRLVLRSKVRSRDRQLALRQPGIDVVERDLRGDRELRRVQAGFDGGQVCCGGLFRATLPPEQVQFVTGVKSGVVGGSVGYPCVGADARETRRGHADIQCRP